MAAPLQPLVLNGLGIYGLNTQSNDSSLPPQWLTKADNIMLDDRGRITSRKGVKQVSENIGTDSSNTLIVKAVGEYRSTTGDATIFASAGSGIYKLETTGSPRTMTLEVFTGTPQTITDGNWQFCNFNGNFYGTQANYIPIHYDGTDWMDLDDTSGYNAPNNVTTFNPSSCLGDFGRLWVGGVSEGKDVLYYSDTLIGHKFNTGAAGYVDLKTVWDGDEIVALASFNGQLIIFGRRNIAIYNGADDPDTMALDEVIQGIGCVARDSVQAVGDELVFLSNSGVRALSRTKIQDKMPLTDFSRNIKDAIISTTISSNKDEVKGMYCLCGGFYVLSFTEQNATYVFDFKYANEDGSPRVTKWTFSNDKQPKSFLSTYDGKLYLGQGATKYKGRIAEYDGYHDREYDGAAYINNTYQGSYRTVWLDFEQPAVSKILKRLYLVIEGGFGMSVALNWYKDYSSVKGTRSLVINDGTVSYLYGDVASLYGAAKFAPMGSPKEYKVALSGAAKVLQLEMIGVINGYKASMASMIIHATRGKIV